MKRKWMLFLFGVLLILSMPKVAYAADHNVNISWYYGRNSEFTNFYNGEGGTKLGETSFIVENGTLDYRTYAESPEGATFYQYYGLVPIIRVNGNYYMLNYIYVESNGDQDQMNFTIDVTDADTDIVIRLGYVKVAFAQPSDLDKIKISIDNSANEHLIADQTYAAYQIFHVTKADSVEEDVTTDETIGQPIGGEDTGFSYYILTSDPWYNVITENMTDWFDITQTTDPTMFLVSLKEGIEGSETTAIEIAKELEKYIEDKPSLDIISGQARTDIDPGYYLIVSPINSNLILATTNIDITEKAFYPSIVKEVAETDKNTAIGSEVHFTSTISIPQGSKGDMIITDTMTEGLRFNPESLELSHEINYTIETNNHGFTINISGEDLKQLTTENIELVLTYTATLNKKAIIQPRDDSTIDGNVNTIKLEYVNYIQESSVDVDTTSIQLLKYASGDENKTPIAGATFELLDQNKEVIPLYEIEPGKIYRLTTDKDTSSMNNFTTIDNEQVQILGLDADLTYYLRETKAPAGYNLANTDIEFTPTVDLSTVVELPNSQGVELPSTGGIGTTLLYIVGSLMIVGGGTAIWTKNK